MNAREAMTEILRMLDLIEIRGERSVSAMSRVIALAKGVLEAMERTGDERHDNHDEQGKNVHG